MFLPYFHKISIDDLYYHLSYLEMSEIRSDRIKFQQLRSFSWRIITHSDFCLGKFTFPNFEQFYQFVKFAYIVYPTLSLTVLYQRNEKDF